MITDFKDSSVCGSQRLGQEQSLANGGTGVPSLLCGRRGGLMVSALDSGASGPGSSPGQGHCAVFLGKTLHSHSASLHPGV